MRIAQVLIVSLVLALTSDANQLRAKYKPLSNTFDVFLQQDSPSQEEEEGGNSNTYTTNVARLDNNGRLLNPDGTLADVGAPTESDIDLLGTLEEILSEGIVDGQVTEGLEEEIYRTILESFQDTVEEGVVENNQRSSIGTFTTSSYDANNDTLFGLQDVDDDQLIRMDNGIYRITFMNNINQTTQRDFDEQLNFLRAQANSYNGDTISSSTVQGGELLDSDDRSEIQEISQDLYNTLINFVNEPDEADYPTQPGSTSSIYPQGSIQQARQRESNLFTTRSPVYYRNHILDSDEGSDADEANGNIPSGNYYVRA